MSLPFSNGKIKVFVSSVSLDKEIKLQQQRVIQCLEAKQISHVVADLATSASDKRELRVLMMGDPKPPPQIFNGNDYCGDYAAFCLALEDEILEEFLKLKDSKKPKKNSQESSSTERSEAKKDEKTGTEGKPESNDETEKVQKTVGNLGQNATAVIDKEKVTNENTEDKTPISEAVISDEGSEDEDESESESETENSEKLPPIGKSQEADSSPAARTRDSPKGDKKTNNISPVKTQSIPVPSPPPPPLLLPPPPPPPPPPAHVPPPPPPTLKTSDAKPSEDAHQLPQSLLADIRSSTKLKLKPTPKPTSKLPGPSKGSGGASSGTTAPAKEAMGDGKPKFSAEELFKGRMALKSKYDRSVPKTANLASVKGSTSDSKKATPFGDKISSVGKNLSGDSSKPGALLASILKASRNKK